MLNRRELLIGGVAAGLAPALPAFADQAAPAQVSESAKLRALFDEFFQRSLLRSPELATSLGVDKGDLAGLKRRLSERSPAAVARNAADTERRLNQLRSIDRAALPGADAVSYDTVLFTTEVRNEGDRSFNYGGGGSGEPYIAGCPDAVPAIAGGDRRAYKPGIRARGSMAHLTALPS